MMERMRLGLSRLKCTLSSLSTNVRADVWVTLTSTGMCTSFGFSIWLSRRRDQSLLVTKTNVIPWDLSDGGRNKGAALQIVRATNVSTMSVLELAAMMLVGLL